MSRGRSRQNRSRVASLTLTPLSITSPVSIAGIAGINPHQGTLGSVAVSRFAIQVALQQELDAREKPENWTTGCKSTSLVVGITGFPVADVRLPLCRLGSEH